MRQLNVVPMLNMQQVLAPRVSTTSIVTPQSTRSQRNRAAADPGVEAPVVSLTERRDSTVQHRPVLIRLASSGFKQRLLHRWLTSDQWWFVVYTVSSPSKVLATNASIRVTSNSSQRALTDNGGAASRVVTSARQPVPTVTRAPASAQLSARESRVTGAQLHVPAVSSISPMHAVPEVAKAAPNSRVTGSATNLMHRGQVRSGKLKQKILSRLNLYSS